MGRSRDDYFKAGRQLLAIRRRLSCGGGKLFCLEPPQKFFRAQQHRRRKPGQSADFDSIGPVGATRLQAMKKKDLIPDFTHLDIIVSNCY